MPLSRKRRIRLLAVLLALPAATLLAATAYTAVGREDGDIPLAQGTIGGVLHPIAGYFEPDETELASCGDDLDCLDQAFGNVAYYEGPPRALALFEEQMKTDPTVERNCHRISHTIGSAALALFDGNVAVTFSRGSPTCASGYYHGILERAFVGVDTRKRLVQVARSLCEGTGIRRFGFLDYQCRHGLGHGLMIQSGYDLPLALETCSGLQTGWDEVTCTGGVFMENLSTRFGFKSRWIDDADPFAPCGTVAVAFKRSCYLRSAVRVLALNGGDFPATARSCAQLAPQWRVPCFRAYGRDASAHVRFEPARVHALCKLARAWEGACLYGAARTTADNFQKIERAAPVCRSAPAAHREACFAGLGVVIGLRNATPAARRAVCASVTRQHVAACAESANAEVHPSGRWAWG